MEEGFEDVGQVLPIPFDLDDDGHEDRLDVHDGTFVVDGRTGRRTRIDDRFRYVWPVDLEGTPGADFAEPDRDADRTRVWSLDDVLDGAAPTFVDGLPRALTPAGESVFLRTDPPGLRFRGHDLVAGGEPAHRVEHVFVLDDDTVGLRVDRRLVAWRCP